VDAVAEAIRTHQPKDEPVLTEAVLLRDADILEQLGAIGALRALVKVGRDNRFPTFSSVVPVLEGSLRRLPGALRLTSSRSLAESRIESLRLLLAAIQDEANKMLF
jgi:uncharacterized protein